MPTRSDRYRTAALIDAARTPAGAWTRETLAAWGIPWPPPAGWKMDLLRSGVPCGPYVPDDAA